MTTVQLHGIVDRFLAPRTLSGWVVNSEKIGNGRDIEIFIRRDGRLIGGGRLETRRPDLVDAPDYVAGFTITCSENIPDEVVAFNLLKITVSDESGHTSQIGFDDHGRGIALTKLLRDAPPLGKISAGAVLTFLARSSALPEIAKQALIDCRDTHLSSDPEPLAPQPASAVIPSTPDLSQADPDRWLMLQFESLGHNCLLGGMQRSFGAEPLGLLRFAGIGVDSVTKALADRFNGVGNPEYTRLKLHDGEYVSYDTRYHMASHTFIREGEVDFDHFYQQHCKKLSFLVRKIIEDLEEGQKIFTIHTLPDPIAEKDLNAVRQAIRLIGPARILYVQQATETLPSGTVTEREDGILCGYVLYSSEEFMKPARAVSDSWLAVCRTAHEYGNAREPQ